MKEDEQRKREDQQKYLESLPKQYVPYRPTKVFASKYQEFTFGEWRRYQGNPRVHVTQSTIVPDRPKHILTEPDDVAYHMKVAEIDEKIEGLNSDIKDIRAKLQQQKSDMIDGQQARNPI